MTDKSDARERALIRLEAAATLVTEWLDRINDRDGTALGGPQWFELGRAVAKAREALATPLPEAVPAADLEREAREVLATELGRADPDYEWEASNIRIGSGGEKWDCAIRAMLAFRDAGRGAPVDMLLFCPKCGLQHIDEPDERTPEWSNPPHRSHLCHACGCIWRPADVPTNGVVRIATQGKADTWGESNSAALAAPTPQPSPAQGSALSINGDPATSADIAAIGARMDAEDGGYPQPSPASAGERIRAKMADPAWCLRMAELERDATIGAGRIHPEAPLPKLYSRACEVVRHDSGCPAIGGNGDADCTCDAVPFLRDLEKAILAALTPDAGQGVEEEREREACAQVADHWSDPASKVISAMCGLTDAEHEIARRTAEGIAAAIRARSAASSDAGIDAWLSREVAAEFSPAAPDSQEGGGDA